MLHSGSARTLGHMIYYTIENETSIKHISSTFSHSSGAMLLVSNNLSQAWVLYFHAAYVLHCESKLMTMKTASSSTKDGILTYTKRVLISWDPGGSDPVMDAATGCNWHSSQLQYSHQTWDPYGCMQHRLEGKLNLKEGIASDHLTLPLC
jgi:hypothetical protein